MFKNLFKKIDSVFGIQEESDIGPEEKFFFDVVGYSDIKKLFMKSIVSKEPVHILLTGPPASSKTVFLLEMAEELNDAYYLDSVGASGPGMVGHLFENDTKYLLVDEIDKMKKNDQAALLNVMETGILSETKLKGKTRQKKMKLWIFAASNEATRLIPPLRSRFMELHLEEYSFDEFIEITSRLLKKRYHLERIITERIGYSVWNKMKSKDIRDVIKIAKLTRSLSDVDWLVDVQMKYGRRKDP
ncbi:MAG TPA: AAA family ATPase [Nitrososphaeraceae archaeon]|jgi:Holliday junction DNA helicase RuvB|nr:AAA family ATPase [Nitrososphaeraceae archaeon]